MSFDIVASSFQHKEVERTQLERTVRAGVIGGGTIVLLNVFGLIAQFSERWIIEGVITLAHTVFLLIAVAVGALIAHRSPKLGVAGKMFFGAMSGTVAGLMLFVLIQIFGTFDIRNMFVALSPKLLAFLTMGLGTFEGGLVQVAAGAVAGAVGALFYVFPRMVRRPLVIGIAAVFFVGLFSELIQLAMQFESVTDIREYLFTWEGQTPIGAITVFAVVFVAMVIWQIIGGPIETALGETPKAVQYSVKGVGIAIALGLFLLFPWAAGSFFGQVLLTVGLFTLMGMGLNLEVGLAGLLDMGFVAFFATGAYSIALLTADNPYTLHIPIWPFNGEPMNWWEALPFAMLASLFMGFMFGIPVLKVRGDYLAVATLGLGEIIRIIVLSDTAEPLLGGSQGLLHIPSPVLFGYPLQDPNVLFYLTLIASLIAAWFAWALENSRLGRAWMAIREDEDVGQALGINLVNVKMLAYGLGAVFAGLAGAIFAIMLGSIFPHSFQLLISINILALIIVGGIGSLPGVVVGSAMLMGTPELLREFGEYRYLVYGFVLILMMRVKPIGLWPSAARKRELQSFDEAETMIKTRTVEQKA